MVEQHERVTESNAASRTEIDGFALASFVIGAVSLFFALQLFPPVPGSYVAVTLLVPVAGLVTASLARHRMSSTSDLRGRPLGSSGQQFALAGAILSGLSILVLILSEIFIR